MVARRWDPFTVLARLDDEFDELVRRSWGPTTSRTFGYVPAVDMATEGSDVVLTLELPGVDIDKDVEIEVHDGRLTVSGQRRDEHDRSDESGRVLVKELRYGSFRREFALPEGVGADDVSAHYDSGLLRIRVRNVTRPAEAPRKIAVTSGGSTPKTISGEPES
jgi:HSP20 family protein